MQARPLRDFEQGAHLHVLDWMHDTARYRFQTAGAIQIKAATKTVLDAPTTARGPLQLPSLEAALVGELQKLYALGHATVRSELDHQANGETLPIGLSAAPEPPNLRKAKARKGRFPHCGTCTMFDGGRCWGYGNWPVKPNQVCDSYEPEARPKQLAVDPTANDPGNMRARGRLAAAATAHAIFDAVQRARLHGITSRRALKDAGRAAGNAALAAQASHHAGGAISAGRHAAAQARAGEIMGARYTSVLDKNTCGPCAAQDTGELLPLDQVVTPPNPACLGGDRCRCLLVYQLIAEKRPASKPAPPPPVVPIRSPGYADVGVGSS